jgi:hypothetical protein
MFVEGFKLAAFDHNNQGLEFKMDDFNTGNTGAGGMAPSGIPRYQPVSTGDLQGGKKKPKRTLASVADMIFKYSSGMEDAALSSGSISQDGSDQVNQLKSTFSNGPTLEQEATQRKEQKNRRKAYVKASLK